VSINRGPIQAVRKSTRQLENGETMLEKAQKMKRKANLEENPGNQFNLSNVPSQNDILMLAKNMDIGINITSEPNNIVKKVVDLDRDRISTFSSACKGKECIEVDVKDRNPNISWCRERPLKHHQTK
jgi:hypothetical protein